MGEKLLKIENLSKSYNAQTQALADVNITLDKGEFVVVIGPSGAGKSTLIRCINRMIEPTEGKIVFDGTEITSMNNRQMRKVRTQIGMIFQNYNLIDRTSVRKNVLHGRLGQMSFWESVFGLYRQADVETAMHLLEQTGLAEQKYKRADELSGGQMQRVGICRSLIQNPKLILADEPIASLDPKSAEIVMEALYQMTTSRGLTCVVNLHQVDFAKKYATRIIGIKAGHVVYDGLPGDLTDAMIRSIYEGKEMQMKLRSELVYA